MSKCRCKNHRGTAKAAHKTREAAVDAILRRHLRHGAHEIYQCPTSTAWHVTSVARRQHA